MEALIAFGANINAKNSYNQTPLDIASENQVSIVCMCVCLMYVCMSQTKYTQHVSCQCEQDSKYMCTCMHMPAHACTCLHVPAHASMCLHMPASHLCFVPPSSKIT